MTRQARRLGALVVVGAATLATLVYAAGGHNGLAAVQPITVIATPGSGSVSLTNVGNTVVQVGTITPDSGCASGITASPLGGFSVGVGSARTIGLMCGVSVAAGLRRCTFHVHDPMDVELVDFEVVCEDATMANLTPTPNTFDFNTVGVGTTATTTFTFNNPSPTTITELFFEIDDPAGDFSIGSPCNPHAPECDQTIAPLGPGSGGSFDVNCTPQSVGTLTADVYLVTDTHQRLTTPITLTCTGTASSNPVLSVNPTSVDVGSVEVISATGTADLAIKNSGGGTLTIADLRIVDTGTGAALDWTATESGTCMTPSCMLTGTQELDVHLVFDPSAIGGRGASLVISYHDTADRTMSVPLDGIGLGATLSVVGNTTAIDFGIVPVGMPSQVTFQLANTGNRDLADVTLAVTPSGPPFSLSPATTAMVSHTAPTTITATCMPTAAGTFMTTFSASAPDAFMSPPISIAAKCEGSTQALFSMPTTIALGEVRTGTATQHVPVMALGAGVTVSTAQLETTSSNLDLTVPTLPAATPVSLDLAVMPTADGDLTNHVVVTAANGDSLHIPITGKVVTASFFVQATAVLGTFCVNQSTTGSSLALVSTGTATITLQKPVMAMVGSPFDLTLTSPSSYPSALPAMASATVDVTPRPQAVAGTQLDDLVWTTDVTGNAMPHTMLSAVFVDNGGAIAPSSLGFGKVAVSHVDRPNGQRVTLQNCGTAALQLSSQLDSPFTIEGASVPTSLQPSESATISVGFHPQSVGTYVGNLTITVVGGTPLTVALTGEGVIATSDGDAGPTSDNGSRTSFYACGCRTIDPGSGGPLLLVAWLVFRRRRP